MSIFLLLARTDFFPTKIFIQKQYCYSKKIAMILTSVMDQTCYKGFFNSSISNNFPYKCKICSNLLRFADSPSLRLTYICTIYSLNDLASSSRPAPHSQIRSPLLLKNYPSWQIGWETKLLLMQSDTFYSSLPFLFLPLFFLGSLVLIFNWKISLDLWGRLGAADTPVIRTPTELPPTLLP